MIFRNLRVRNLCILLFTLTLHACGSGSGASTAANPVTTTATVTNYSGPAPATTDVQAFKLHVWDNLVPNNRCGSCHNESQSPRFVRADDINLAYAEANELVDLADPGASLMVTKVRGGHNCWLTSDDACGDILETYIQNWAGDTYGGAGKEVELEPPPIRDPGASKNFPADSGLFATTVYPLLTTYCASCHADSAAVPQSPYFASEEVDAAYAAAQPRMDLGNPANSRFVLRLGSEFHNCWSDCTANSNEMLSAITDLSNAIPSTQVDPNLVTSKALSLVEGIVSSAGGRHETNAIALYEFKTGSGNTVFDTSGVEPSLNLTLSGAYDWVGGWGVQFVDGKAQGSTTASAKLRNLIRSTGEYTIELWAAPGNVTQDGPARIVSYAGDGLNRNFMIGQTLYNYDAFNRGGTTAADGSPQLSTPDADEILQATLQHVVVTYDPANGRQIFVNGTNAAGADPTPTGALTDWNETYALALGSEVDNEDRWAGTIRLLAIHNRALTDVQIQQNYDAGVGERYFMLFSISDHIGIADAYIVFEVSQFDSYSYLFNEPFFVILDEAESPGNIALAGMRIGLNGREARVGQAFVSLDTSLNDGVYTSDSGQRLSDLGTVIPLEKGPVLDEFFLTFEQLGGASNVVVEASPVAPPPPAPLPLSPDFGIRDFAEVNATMSRVTGIPVSDPDVRDTYLTVREALPVEANIAGFISSQQMGVTQLAIKYCAALVDDTVARTTYFPGLAFGADPDIALSDTDLVINPLLQHIVGSGLTTQPDPGDVRLEMDTLIQNLKPCPGGNCSGRTESIVKAACASLLGSAAMMIQ